MVDFNNFCEQVRNRWPEHDWSFTDMSKHPPTLRTLYFGHYFTGDGDDKRVVEANYYTDNSWSVRSSYLHREFDVEGYGATLADAFETFLDAIESETKPWLGLKEGL